MINVINDSEIFWIEDENNLMELTVKSLISNRKGSLQLSNNPEGFPGSNPDIGGNDPKTIGTDLSTAVLFTKPKTKDYRYKFFRVNSKIKAVPLLLLTGPSDEMRDILKEFNGRYGCFKIQVNYNKFLKKMQNYPMVWASIGPASKIKE